MLPSTIEETLERFTKGEDDPCRRTDALLAHIVAHDAELHAYVTLDEAGARAQAAAAKARYESGRPLRLDGIPLSIKDNFDLQGLPTGCGHPAPELEPAEKDAEVVRRLREAGAVLLGKTQMHEVAFGISGENAALGTPRNPFSADRVPGGSSSGSAVSVAAGMALGSLGSDTGGSVRVPAALCGLVGFKPTAGRLSTEGLFPLSPTMDHVGVLARTVADTALLFDVLDVASGAGAALAAFACEAPAIAQPGQALAPRLTGPGRPRASVAMIQGLCAAAEPALHEHLGAACCLLEESGARVEVRALHACHDALRIYGEIVAYEAAVVHADALARTPERFGEDVRVLLERGARSSEARYLKALDERAAFTELVEGLFACHDALLCPTTLVPAPRVGAERIEAGDRTIGVREALLSCTCPWSLIGLPAITLPAGFIDGLPVGLQLVGKRGGDHALLALATWVEAQIA